MKARLFCTTGLLAGASFEFSHEATIGKKKDNTIVIDQPVISGRHARIFFDENAACYFLEDNGSRNGTKVDGVKVTQRERLGDLHIITLAKRFDFIFQVDRANGAVKAGKGTRRKSGASSAAKPPAQRTIVGPIRAEGETKGVTPWHTPADGKTMIEGVAAPPAERNIINDGPKTVSEVISVNNKITPSMQPGFLLIIKREPESKTFALKPGENVIGRTPQCDIFLDDPSVSRQHAILTVLVGKIFLKDLESKNHTFAGQRLVTGEIEIKPEVNLRFGKVEARVIRKA